jgi:uncharacterized OB-fold protein
MLWTYGALEPDGGGSFPPEPDPDSAPFWELLAVGKLAAQRCLTCGQWRFPPGPRCRRCHGTSLQWTELVSIPRLYSWIVVNRPTHPGVVVPYAVCLAEFAEGVRVPGGLVVPAGTRNLTLGVELEAAVDTSQAHPRLQFRPATADRIDREVVRSGAVEA